MIGYLVAALGIGIIYLIKYAEFNIWWGTMADNKAAADAWISNGVAFEVTSGVMGALSDVVDSFNTFMEELENGDDNQNLITEFMVRNATTGLMEMPDFVIHLPNGLVLEVIKGEEVMDFRINSAAFDFKGAVLWEHQFGSYAQNCVCIAMRLTADPTFEFLIPGTTDFNFVDPLDGTVKHGHDCTPVQGIKDTDALNLASTGYVFGLICKALKAMGLNKTVAAWWQRYLLKRNFSRVRDEIQEVSDLIDLSSMKVAEINSMLNSFLNDIYGSPSKFINKLKELGYHPY